MNLSQKPLMKNPLEKFLEPELKFTKIFRVFLLERSILRLDCRLSTLGNLSLYHCKKHFGKMVDKMMIEIVSNKNIF